MSDTEAGPSLTAVLDFEAAWESRASSRLSSKESEIRKAFGISPSRYYQLLGRFITTKAALEHNPALVNRLIRLRDRRRAERFNRTRPIHI